MPFEKIGSKSFSSSLPRILSIQKNSKNSLDQTHTENSQHQNNLAVEAEIGKIFYGISGGQSKCQEGKRDKNK